MGAATPTASQSQIAQMVVDSANRYGVPPNIALGVAAHESGFNPNATNTNTNGTVDYGVMQLNSTTVQTLGISNPFDPQTNIDAGVSLLAKYLQQYGNTPQALQAYASGPGTVASGAAPNAIASSFISYVSTYTPPAGLDLSATGTPASSDDSGSVDASVFPDLAGSFDLSDPTTIGVLGLLGAGLVYAILS